jgi:hypothetical protein
MALSYFGTEFLNGDIKSEGWPISRVSLQHGYQPNESQEGSGLQKSII